MLFIALTAVLFLSLAVVAPEPKLTRDEMQLYHNDKIEFYARYVPVNTAARPVRYYDHLVAAHPTIEQDALAHAHTPGNGPYKVTQRNGAVYASTLIRGHEGPARRWNLNQKHSRWDANVLWRIDDGGAKLLRFDIWPHGAETHEVMPMQDAIRLLHP